MKTFLCAVFLLAASLAQAATIPTVVGIYGRTLRIYAGHHEDNPNLGATVQCYTALDGAVLEYVTCFDFIKHEFIPGPNCALVDDVIRCDLEEHPITALDVRFRDNLGPNLVAIQGALPNVTKLSLKGSTGIDQFGGNTGDGPTGVLPDLLSIKATKKSGTWVLR